MHLAEGAVLRLHPDYDAYIGNEVSVIAEESDRAAIVASGQSGICLSGQGIIEAPGAAYIRGELNDMGTHLPAVLRPRVLVFERCSDIRLEDFTVTRSPMWTIHLVACQNVTIQDVQVDNDRQMPNTDGIVVDACEDVDISGCAIATADDGIVLKTSISSHGQPAGACRSIRIHDCKLESRSCALKIGTESFGDFENISFTDCEIVKSNRALGIFSRDGGTISNIRFQRIAVDCEETPDGFWGSGEAITVNCIDRRSTQPAGQVRQLLFEDITGRMEGAVNLFADNDTGIEDVVFRRIRLKQEAGPFLGGKYDLRPSRFDLAPSADASGRANAWVKDEAGDVIGLVSYPQGMPGLFASNIRGLSCEDVHIERPGSLPPTWNSEITVILHNEPNRWS